MSMFRAYDIRGIYGKDITPDIANLIGKSFGTFGNFQKISLGRDNRISSDILHENLITGLISTGIHVMDIGIVPTPLLYFSNAIHKLDGGIMITASHNPAEFNGFKLNKSKLPFFPEEIQKIKEIIEKRKFKTEVGKVSELDIVPDYINFHTTRFKPKRALKVVVDSGNGTTGVIAPILLRKIGCIVYELYTKLDGAFPNHFPDPTKYENLKDLQIEVLNSSADLGIAFDGDGDRVVFIDNKGKILEGDQTLAIISRFLLKELPNAKILMDVKCSNLIEKTINQMGGKAIYYQTGHSFIKRKIIEDKIDLAGELSGHFYFNFKYKGFDDGIHAAVRLITYLSQQSASLNDLYNDLPKAVSSPELNIKCLDEHKFKVVEELKQVLAKHYEVIDIDGVRINFPNGWGLIRGSNTEPKLVLRFEGKNKKDLDEIKKIFIEPLEEIMKKIN
ncbi:MAG: phosphomannomutase/phosphoglucomutase [Candidatus Lokiarchaeota archaeon]|nr:phosphomannomutase/phosphoglucomutase [Candidatus Lokiarchaeota archaeon]